MKKYALLLLTLICAAKGYSQEFYMRAGIGWAFPHAGQTMDGTSTAYSGASNNYSSGGKDYFSYNIDKISLNSGPQATLGAGYMFTNHIGLDLAFTGALSTNEYSYAVTGENLNNVASDVVFISKAQNPLIVTPSIVLQTGCQFNVYSRMGLVVPLKTTVIQDQVISNQPGTGAPTVYDYTFELHNRFSLGLSGALGASYKTKNGLSIWLETSLVSLPVYTKTADIVDVTVNGISYLQPFLQGNPGTINYSRNFTAERGDFFNQPSYALPFSNIGLNLGVSFALGGDKSESRNNNKSSRK